MKICYALYGVKAFIEAHEKELKRFPTARCYDGGKNVLAVEFWDDENSKAWNEFKLWFQGTGSRLTLEYETPPHP